jgi:hypothetical protein
MSAAGNGSLEATLPPNSLPMGMIEHGDGGFRSSSEMLFGSENACSRSQGFVPDVDGQMRILRSLVAGLNAVEDNQEGGTWLNGQLNIASLGDVSHHQ